MKMDITHSEMIPEQRDFNAEHIGIQIAADGKRIWVCVDGCCVLRAKTQNVNLTDDRQVNEYDGDSFQ